MARSIFVVDDIPSFLQLMEDVLSEEGYRVSTFTSVSEAAETALQSPPDLIISDVRLDGESGFDLLHALLQHDSTREVPIVVCTAATMDVEEQAEVIRTGRVSVLYKPFDIQDLLDRVSKLLETTPSR